MFPEDFFRRSNSQSPQRSRNLSPQKKINIDNKKNDLYWEVMR